MTINSPRSDQADQHEIRRLLNLHSEVDGNEGNRKMSGGIADRMDFAPGVIARTNNSMDNINGITRKSLVKCVEAFEVSEASLVKVSVADKLQGGKEIIYKKIFKPELATPNKIEIRKYLLPDESVLGKKKISTKELQNHVREFFGVFPYKKSDEANFEVTLNFSDPQGLFHYCWSDLFAQDEIQAMEFPLVLHLREYVEKVQPSILSYDKDKPSATLLKNLPRYGSINSSGIYGQNFAGASDDVIASKTTAIDKPERYNILAMAAYPIPNGEGGMPYENEILKSLLEIAVAGFSAAKAEAGSKHLVINTGNWGTGVFGHNPLLVAIVQIIAAQIAGVNELNYYIPNWKNLGLIEQSKEWMRTNFSEKEYTLDALCNIIINSKSFNYGSSDCN